MAQQTQTRKPRQQRTASPERWARAAQRAIVENIEVRQLNANGMWTASSGSDPKLAYVLEIVAGVVRSCSCPAGEFGDPCCKHAARYYLDVGLLDPEPDPPALGVSQSCPECRSGGVHDSQELEKLELLYPPCVACNGTGIIPAVPASPSSERLAA